MSEVLFTQLDEIGVVKDTRDFLLKPNAWTDARNARFRDGKIFPIKGSASIYSPPVAPYWTLHCFTSALESAWIFAGLEKVYVHTSGSNTNITRQNGGGDDDYSATEDKLWTGGVLGGIPILNNGVDPPQFWSTISTGTDLADLTNWPAGYVCQAIRPFKNFLIAMNMTEGGTQFIHRVRWSHPAAPGAVPSSWDATDPTVDAGRNDLSDAGAGPLVDGMGLRDVFVLGKENSLHGMQFVGGRSKFRFFAISETAGILAKNCIVPEPEGQALFIASGEDVMLCDGIRTIPLIEKRMKRWLQANIDATNYRRSFCVTSVRDDECWFCFPSSGSSWCDLALVWEKTGNTLSIREVEQLSYAASGVITAESETWDSDSEVWDEDDTVWNEIAHQPYLRPLVGCAPASSKLISLDVGTTFQDSPYTAYVERTGLSLVGTDRSGNPTSSLSQRKLVNRVRLHGMGGNVEIQIGTQQKIGGPVTWGAAKVFNLETGLIADFSDQGDCLLWGIRLRATNPDFEIESFSVDVEPTGFF